MRRKVIALGTSIIGLALSAGPALADPGQTITDSTGSGQVGSVEANAPVRVLSDGNDQSDAPAQGGSQNTGGSEGTGQVGSVKADAPVRVLSDGENGSDAPTQPGAS